MTMRVTELMRFNTMNSHLTAVQSRYADILEKMASQRNINKISDDPSGVAMIMNYKKDQSAITGYQRAIDNAQAWIAVTESQLMSANDILVKAQEVAIQYGSDTASEETRLYGAAQISQFIDQLKSVANYQYADRYLFSGTETATTPFAAQRAPEPYMGDPYQGSDNVFQGAVDVTGTYTGDENRSYAVRILSDDGPDNYTWAVSTDGGRTWGAESAPPASLATVELDTGITMEFSDITAGAAVGDIFYVNAYAAGYYMGNTDELSVEISKGVTFEYSITGNSVFSPDGGVDIFSVLTGLKEALENNDGEAIRGSIDGLKQSAVQVNTAIATCGTRANRLEIAKNNLMDLDYKLTELVSIREDVDISALVTDFAMQEIVLKATYSMAAQMGTVTLMDFLR